MFLYLIKRILLIIPTTFIIIVLAFFWGELSNSDQAMMDLEMDENMPYREIDPQRYLQAYHQLRVKYLLDFPPFYFSLKALSEPDTLNRIYPVIHRDFLRQMALEYGRWDNVSVYYLALVDLWKTTQMSASITQVSKVESMFQITQPGSIEKNINELATWQFPSSFSDQWQMQVTFLRIKFQLLYSQQAIWSSMIPIVKFNGPDNKFHRWLIQLLSGDLGISHRDREPVIQKILKALPITLGLTFTAMLLIFAIAIPLGVFLSGNSYPVTRNTLMNMLLGIDAIPLFLLSLLLIIFFAGNDFFNLFPAFGIGPNISESWWEIFSIRIYYMFLPLAALTLASIPFIARQLQVTMEQVRKKDFITTARVKGMKERAIIWRHGFPNALFPLVTIMADFLPGTIGGVLVIEVIFSIHGMGKLMRDSVLSQDYPVILIIILLVALVKLIANILADIAYYWIDPRVRFG